MLRCSSRVRETLRSPRKPGAVQLRCDPGCHLWDGTISHRTLYCSVRGAPWITSGVPSAEAAFSPELPRIDVPDAHIRRNLYRNCLFLEPHFCRMISRCLVSVPNFHLSAVLSFCMDKTASTPTEGRQPMEHTPARAFGDETSASFALRRAPRCRVFSSAGADGCCDFWEQQFGRLVLCGPTKTGFPYVSEFAYRGFGRSRYSLCGGRFPHRLYRNTSWQDGTRLSSSPCGRTAFPAFPHFLLLEG